MPLPFTKTIVAIGFTALLCAGAAPVMAADWDDGGYGYGGRGHRHWRQDGWRHDAWRNRGWDDDGVAVGAALGGFALGAAAAAQPGYGGCYVVDRPIRDEWGNVVDYRSAQVCE